MPSPNIAPTTRLFVGGLPYKITEGELLALFATFGRIISLKIMHTKWGKSRGMGFIEFDNLDSAIAAKTKLHNYYIAPDRTIIVDYAAPDPVLNPELRQKKDPPKAKVFQNQDPFTKQNRGSNKSSLPKRKPYSSSTKESQTTNFVPKSKATDRQSVYNSRAHHSKVGAKFAKRRTR